MKVLLGLFLIAHGLIHSSYLTPKPDDPNYPFSLEKGWFASRVGSSSELIGTLIILVILTSFLVAGLGYLGQFGMGDYWRLGALIGSIASLILLILFWHTWLILGVVIDLVILYGIVVLGWGAHHGSVL